MKNRRHLKNDPCCRPWWRSGLAAMVAVGLLGTAQAQTVEQYSFSTSTGTTLEDMTGAGMLWGVGGGADYVSVNAQSMGFTFTYEDVAYTQYGVNVYGLVALGGGNVGGGLPGNMTQGSGTFPRIFPFGIEAGTVSDGWVKTKLVGSPGSYIRVIEWFTGLPGYDTGVNADIQYQVLFHEATNEIEFRYGNGHGDMQWNNYAPVGIVGASSAHYLNVKTDHTVITNTPNRQWSPADWPGSGRSYLFTPPPSCNAAPNPGDTQSDKASVCSGMAVNLSMENDESGPGILFQWERSTDGGISWDPISGATGLTCNSGPLTEETMFHCAVTCTGTNQTVESNAITIQVSNPTPDYYPWDGSSTYTQNFSTWEDLCSVTDVPADAGGNYWITTPAYGSNTWRANTMHASGGMPAVGSITWNNGAVTPAASFYARQNTNTGTLDFHVDMSNGTVGAMLRFEYYHSVSSGTLQVLVSEDGGASFNQVGNTLSGTSPLNTWITQEFIIGSTSATTVIRLKATGTMANNNPLLVDNFRILPEPTCKKVTGVSATVTGPGEAEVSFTCTTCGGNYIIEYGPTNFTPGTAGTAGTNGTIVNSTGSPETVTGIPGGSYDVYVREDCGGGDYSENSAKGTFTIIAGDYCENAIDLETLAFGDWDIIATTAGASNNAATSACGSMPNRDVFLYHDVAPGATLQIGLWASANKITVAYGGSCPGTTSLTCTNGGYFTIGGYIVDIDGYPTLVWTNNGCDTERIYVMADGTNANGGPLYAFNYDYSVPAGPACQSVTGVGVSTVNTGNGANVSWDASCSGNVIVEYGLAGFTPGTGATAGVGGTATAVNGTTITLSGLTMDVPYDVYVRQDCGDNEYSANGSATTFTVFNGDDCTRIITLAGEDGSLTVTTAGANNDAAFCNAGDTGGDLLFTTTVEPGDGIYITSAPVAPYVGRMVFGAGVSCPGQVLIDCQEGAADFYWQNTTNATVNLFIMQDGADEGTTTISWMKFTFAKMVVSVTTDGNPGDITWELLDENDDVVASGTPATANAENVEEVTLPSLLGDDACYGFRLIDSNGDGIAGGGWELRTMDGRIILRDDFSNGGVSPATPAASAAYGDAHSFCLPLGPADIAPSECGIFNNEMGNKVYANKVTGASNYQFEFSDPDAGFIRRIARPYNYVLFSDMVTSPLVPGVKYFARVRTDRDGAMAQAHWGSGCEMGIGTAVLGCPELINCPAYGHSCNEERSFNTNNSFIYATPITGATEYQFRIFNVGEQYDETFTRPTYILQLKWNSNVAEPLANGSWYNVEINAKVNGVWTGFCPSTCTITINNALTSMPGCNQAEHVAQVGGQAILWPNPVQNGQVNLSIDGMKAHEQDITVEVRNLYGNLVHAQQFANAGERFSTVLNLPGDVASGIYMVNITINGEMTTQRLSIIR